MKMTPVSALLGHKQRREVGLQHVYPNLSFLRPALVLLASEPMDLCLHTSATAHSSPGGIGGGTNACPSCQSII